MIHARMGTRVRGHSFGGKARAWQSAGPRGEVIPIFQNMKFGKGASSEWVPDGLVSGPMGRRPLQRLEEGKAQRRKRKGGGLGARRNRGHHSHSKSQNRQRRYGSEVWIRITIPVPKGVQIRNSTCGWVSGGKVEKADTVNPT